MDFNAEPLTDDFSDARTDAAGYDVYCEGQVHYNMLVSYEYDFEFIILSTPGIKEPKPVSPGLSGTVMVIGPNRVRNSKI